MKLPERFLTTAAAEIKSKMDKAKDNRIKARRVLHRINIGEPVSEIEYFEASELFHEANEIEIYLKNVLRFLKGFNYNVSITDNGAVLIQFDGVPEEE